MISKDLFIYLFIYVYLFISTGNTGTVYLSGIRRFLFFGCFLFVFCLFVRLFSFFFDRKCVDTHIKVM